MLTSFYFLLICLAATGILVCFRYYTNRNQIEVFESVLASGGTIERKDMLADTKDFIFAFFDDIKLLIEKESRFLSHWILHFFVIILGFISDIFDYLYTFTRDKFLVAATKEREVVAKFWPHLKEYKREKEEEK